MDTTHQDMQPFSARLRTFETAQPIRKRQASGQAKKKAGNTGKWPHEKPEPVLVGHDGLARAGFFYRPDQESTDNVTCFMCNVRLDGWEETDVPIQEHLAHTHGCPWATAVSVFRGEDEPEPEMRDPLAEEMIIARKTTFATGEGWPHESKKGWKCKITKMVEAGWCWDPSTEEGDGVDGVTCFYCGLSLDGWEPKDDPFTEHKRREPACRYFELLGQFHGVDAANGKIKKSKSTSKGARASTASKASRISRTSAMSAMSEVPSMPESYVDPLEDVDDSNVTTATNASHATATGATKGKKKSAKAKAPAKGTKGRKKATEESMEDVQYPDLDQAHVHQDVEEEEPVAASKKPKRGTRASKQIDSSVIEISQTEMVAPKKPTRTRKAQKEPEPEFEAEEIQQTANASAAAWVEMQHDFEADDFEPGDQSTPDAEPTKSKRGVKRSSDGSQKYPVLDSSVLHVDVDPEPAPEPAAKRKRGRPKKESTSSVDSRAAPEVDPIELDTTEAQQSQIQEVEAPAKKAKSKAKGKKASTTRSSRSSKAKADRVDAVEEPEDLAKDEMEIEQELARIAAEQASQQAVQEEQQQVNEFEPSPLSGRISKDSAELQKLQDEVEADDDKATQGHISPPRQSCPQAEMTPSPNGSDKENRDSSLIEPSAKQAQPAIVLSPTRTIKIPLAASTPNRSSGKTMLSPSKQISHLTSSKPWTAIDPDIALVPAHVSENGENFEPGQLSELLLDAAGDLKSPEKKMTVEEWIRSRAEKSEEDLRRRCELMVSTFEKEGMRALESVQGIQIVG
ncbi:hypothetical protein M409DRAFT_51796 [Zasmidium cellare ATCC 36951]|uniref:BIR-domain-containing protein n=1 Tax=Zasmidium cellare ATCC 36951 TaxID=1080233 RepID=A0A6A6CS89_ZASCE|nr:uncharacterized protein M409DRAFT_51796 [Zasmidium cellare ATCC 36951]KAF2170024.1 hypothetical protein M409DRAFT_51796 [Zasmidium cellare ATCC 36951]